MAMFTVPDLSYNRDHLPVMREMQPDVSCVRITLQDGSGYLERKELDNFLVDLLVNQYGVRIARHIA